MNRKELVYQKSLVVAKNSYGLLLFMVDYVSRIYCPFGNFLAWQVLSRYQEYC